MHDLNVQPCPKLLQSNNTLWMLLPLHSMAPAAVLTTVVRLLLLSSGVCVSTLCHHKGAWHRYLWCSPRVECSRARVKPAERAQHNKDQLVVEHTASRQQHMVVALEARQLVAASSYPSLLHID